MILSTLLYEGNKKAILDQSGWFLNFRSSVIRSKLIIVNNVDNREELSEILESIRGVKHFFVEDYEQEAIERFKLDIDKKNTLGYYYIIPYFCLLLYLDHGFVFHVSDDCMKEIVFSDEFLVESMKEISSNPRIPVTTLNWGRAGQSYGYDVGHWEQIESFRLKGKKEPEMEQFWYSFGFVDQVFVASVDKLKDVNYNLETYDNPIYQGPWYCPNSWERRLAEYMYKNDQYRGVWKRSDHYYIHPGHKL